MRLRIEFSLQSSPTDHNSNSDPLSSISVTQDHKKYYSKLKKLSDRRVIPTLNENDLEERFVRGGGYSTRCRFDADNLDREWARGPVSKQDGKLCSTGT
jgi:hypothetical protein